MSSSRLDTPKHFERLRRAEQAQIAFPDVREHVHSQYFL
jgi:hypothetical protein